MEPGWDRSTTAVRTTVLTWRTPDAGSRVLDQIRTGDLPLRRRLLYPAELRRRILGRRGSVPDVAVVPGATGQPFGERLDQEQWPE